ncbi:hypothetical protein PIB30_118624 [Stylosanthes scabra]|uniref:Folate-biopterin transporter 1, chloroplastic n=1 Tax=Stylosanthes scabra TaxID=79078 RepID=A0ABU6VL57_9FABA|nr:hypothetical protein [Stylosanthes scabra]
MSSAYMLSLIPFLPSKFPPFTFPAFSSPSRPAHPPRFRRRARRKPPDTEMSVTVSRSGSSLRIGSDDAEPFLGSRTGAGKGDTLTTETDLEACSTSSKTSAPRKNKYRLRNITLFGVDLSPDNIAVAMVYFVQGVLGLARLAVNFFLKDDLHLDPAETAVISGFSALPWLIKPLYGFISDSVPLFGYRRRSYLVLSGLLGALSWSLMATFVDSKYGAAFCTLIGSLSVAFSDVVSNSCLVI